MLDPVLADTRLFAAASRNIAGYVTAKSVTDIYYIVHRFFYDDKMTRKVLNRLLVIFDIMDTSSEDCRQVLLSQLSDFEDAVMMETARRSEADCIVTRNIKDYTQADITVYTLEEFIRIVKAVAEED